MRDDVKIWWKQAETDLKAAENSFKSKDYYACAFWCQQAVEKALKGLLIKRKNTFPKVHDLTKLAKLNNTPLEIIKLCAKLNPAYTASRYPDAPIKYTKEDCKKIIKYSQEILKWIKKNIY